MNRTKDLGGPLILQIPEARENRTMDLGGPSILQSPEARVNRTKDLGGTSILQKAAGLTRSFSSLFLVAEAKI